MKRARKLTIKPDPVEESPDDSDSDESTQPKKGKGKKAIKLTKPPESQDNSDSDEVPTPATKKVNAKGKKAKRNKSEDSDTEKTPEQTLKNCKGKGMKTTKIEVSPHNSDSDEAPSKTKTKAKEKGKNTKLSKPADDSSHNSDSETKPTQIKKKTKNKKAIKKEPEGESSDNSDSEEKLRPKEKGKTKQKSEENKEATEDELSSDMELGSGAVFNPKRHKQSLENLRSVDPDFYKFLQKHDVKLLKFDDYEKALDEEENEDDLDEVELEDDLDEVEREDNLDEVEREDDLDEVQRENDLDEVEREDDVDEEEREDDLDEENVHVPGELHGDSDESDFEAEDEKPIKGKVTLKMVKDWEAEMQKEGKMKPSVFIHAVKLFRAAVSRATSEDGTTEGEYHVAGSSVFNAIINMCVLYLPGAIKKYLGTDISGKNPQKCKHFVKIKGILIQYLTDALKLLSVVTSDNILIIMLKHFHQMTRFVACFTRIAKKAIKRLLTLWSTGEETVRVLAFLCILRITRNQQEALLEPVLKVSFMTYVNNCKFVSPTTWPNINFMRRSLVELYSLDLDVSYQLVYLYIRQLGIHLRNAIMVPRKEHKRVVYNWQYLNVLHLWAQLLQHTNHHSGINSLIYPLTMIISNTIKLVPTPQYYPLRFYLTDVLLDLSRESDTFIPTVGFMMDILYHFDFNKVHTKVSMKPMDFSCTIRLSKSQMSESGFTEAVMYRWYGLVLQFATTISYTSSFPEVCMIFIVYLHKAINKCTVPNHKKKLKQLLDKLDENSNFIRNKRTTADPNCMLDLDALLAWQARIKAEGTPLMSFYETWSKLNNIQKRKIITKNDEPIGSLPMILRRNVAEEAKEHLTSDTTTPIKLFPSDSEDEIEFFKNDDENKPPPKVKKLKIKVQKKKDAEQNHEDDNLDAADAGDIVQEFSARDW